MRTRFLTLILALLSTGAQASFDFQWKNIVGDWDFGQGYIVMRIQKQGEDTIKVYSCNRNALIQSSTCKYSKITIYKYNSNFDGFCLQKGRVCETGLQVSSQYPTELIEMIDPLFRYNFSNSGETIEARRR